MGVLIRRTMPVYTSYEQTPIRMCSCSPQSSLSLSLLLAVSTLKTSDCTLSLRSRKYAPALFLPLLLVLVFCALYSLLPEQFNNSLCVGIYFTEPYILSHPLSLTIFSFVQLPPQVYYNILCQREQPSPLRS